MFDRDRNRMVLCYVAALIFASGSQSGFAQAPPIFNTVFPAGGQSGQSIDVTVKGSHLQSLQYLHCNAANVRCVPVESNRPEQCQFRLTIPPNTAPGLYDLWAVGTNGVSGARSFVIGNRSEHLESEPNASRSQATPLPLNVTVNGQIDKANDWDFFRFDAVKDQCVVIECFAERIDSRLRAVLEVQDSTGRRQAVNRGYYGIDPLIDFRVPSDGTYFVKVQDLTSTGSEEHYYRLDIDTGPRVSFSVPAVIQRGVTTRVIEGESPSALVRALLPDHPANNVGITRVRLFGWNLQSHAAKQLASFGTSGRSGGSSAVAGTPSNPSVQSSVSDQFDFIDVEIPPSLAQPTTPLHTRLSASQAILDGEAFPYYFPGGHAPIVIGVTDSPVVLDTANNHSPGSAQVVPAPCEISGQLIESKEQDWYAISARRGEVFYIEGLGQRIHSPVDLQLSVFDAAGERELAQFSDEVRNIGGAISTAHLDPAGRWVCPSDGPYLIMVRNLISGLQADPRRVYRLSIRREVPDFQLVAVPRQDISAGLSVRRGGREIMDLFAIRRRGCDGPIRVVAANLPDGIECPDVWFGPGVERTQVVVSARPDAAPQLVDLQLLGIASAKNVNSSEPITEIGRRATDDSAMSTTRQVQSATIVRSGTPTSWARLTPSIPLAVSLDAPLRIEADAHEILDHHLYGKLRIRHSPGGIVDVAVRIERREAGHQAPVKLIGTGLPEMMGNQTTIVPAGQDKGYLSFWLPPTLPTGPYSFVVRGETTVPSPDKKTETVIVHSNPVVIDVQSSAFQVEVDPFVVTRAKRGETIQIAYSAKRLNGFIGKLHTELASPGRITDVGGLRVRGETFVGQTDRGSLQIIVNDDAPLGRQPFLRLFTVGVLEDEPIFHGSSLLALEIVE